MTFYYDTENFSSKMFPSSKQIGWIAQDVQEHIPELVETTSDGYLMVAYSRAVPLLAEALKSMQEQIEL